MYRSLLPSNILQIVDGKKRAKNTLQRSNSSNRFVNWYRNRRNEPKNANAIFEGKILKKIEYLVEINE